MSRELCKAVWLEAWFQSDTKGGAPDGGDRTEWLFLACAAAFSTTCMVFDMIDALAEASLVGDTTGQKVAESVLARMEAGRSEQAERCARTSAFPARMPTSEGEEE